MGSEDSTGISDLDLAFTGYDNFIRVGMSADKINLVVKLVREGDLSCATFDLRGPGSDVLPPAALRMQPKLKEANADWLIILI